MPTTKAKNTLYRLALPFFGARAERHPSLRCEGHPVAGKDGYARLLRKHHVLGSAAVLARGSDRALILCDQTEPARTVTADSYFRVASITKMAAALAAMVTVERGLLELDAPAAPVLSACAEGKAPALPETVTLRRLLSHTAGIVDPPGMETALLQGKPFPELMAGAKGEPGLFCYSNLGFGLVGCLLEAVWKEPVTEILRKIVFEPLGMRATLDASTLREEEIVPISRVLPYRPGADIRTTKLGQIPLTAPDPMRHYGHTAGAMYTDIGSLEKMIRCLMQGGAPILSGAYGRQMTEKQAEYGPSSPALSYGLGVLMIKDPTISEHRILGHQGFAYGCVDGAFWEEDTGRILIFLNGGASEYRRKGKLGAVNEEMLRWAFKEEMVSW